MTNDQALMNIQPQNAAGVACVAAVWLQRAGWAAGLVMAKALLTCRSHGPCSSNRKACCYKQQTRAHHCNAVFQKHGDVLLQCLCGKKKEYSLSRFV
jgi:hypothetical protein